MAEGFQKEYAIGSGGFTPAFSVDPTEGLAALDVQFQDTSFTNDFIIQKEYVPSAGLPIYQKEYV